MNKHMKVYMFMTLTLPQLTDQEKLTRHDIGTAINYLFNYSVDPDLLMDSIKLKPPTLAQKVHALIELGFQPKFIAEHLKIDPPNVSYYKRQDPGNYVNIMLNAQDKMKAMAED